MLQLKVPEAFDSKSIRRRLDARPVVHSACAAPSVALHTLQLCLMLQLYMRPSKVYHSAKGLKQIFADA